MATEQQSSTPRRMVHQAQAEATNAIHRYRRVHQQAGDANQLEQARELLHSGVMLYWEQMKRFAHRKEIKAIWAQDTVFGSTTLEDLRQYRFASDTHRQQVTDPDSGGTDIVTVEQPWRLQPRQALAVHDQLDKCAHKLGFDADVQSSRDRYHISDSSDGGDSYNEKVKAPE